MIQTYQDRVFEDWDYTDTLNQALLEMVQQSLTAGSSKAALLDIGCSTGALGRELKQTASAALLYGMEFFPRAAQAARQWYREVFEADLEKVIRAETTLEAILGNRQFDVIVMGDILEHLSYPEKILLGIKPFLKPGGRLIVSIPNVAFWPIRLRLLLGDFAYSENGIFASTANAILQKDHLKFYTLETAKQLLTCNGFTIDRIQNNNGTRPMRFLGRFWPRLFAFQFVMDCSLLNSPLN